MLRFILHRLLFMIPVVIGISFIVFTILSLNPADPAAMILGTEATPERVQELREEMGLDDSFIIQYLRWGGNILKGDFGTSWRTNYPVSTEFMIRIPVTMKLALGATLLFVLIGVPLGIISAVKQYSIIDNLSIATSLLLTSVPGFWLGLLLMLLFSLHLGWFPTSGIGSLQHYVLPCITAATTLLASLIRMTRSSMLEVIRQDYVRTAKAKGAKNFTVIMKHAFRNALLPVITVIGLNFGILMGGAILTETVFAMPGLGTLLVTSVRNIDIPTVMAIILFISVAIGLVNLLVDVVYAFVDPRVKAQYLKR